MNPAGRKTAVARRPARRRRSAVETRAAILAAAQRCLIVGGPEAIRLQRIAADAGISHPAILHHFGSREGLVEAMVLDGFAKLQAQVLEGWPSLKEPDVEGVFERFYAIIAGRGVARMLAWLILSGQSLGTKRLGFLRPAAERMHAGRIRRAERAGRRYPRLEETLFAASLLAIIILGDSMFGPTIRRAMDLRSKDDDARFHRWLIKVIERLEHPR